MQQQCYHRAGHSEAAVGFSVHKLKYPTIPVWHMLHGASSKKKLVTKSLGFVMCFEQKQVHTNFLILHYSGEYGEGVFLTPNSN
jgi:hypothetical protein